MVATTIKYIHKANNISVDIRMWVFNRKPNACSRCEMNDTVKFMLFKQTFHRITMGNIYFYESKRASFSDVS